jgi:hypothetical protein
MRVQGQFFFVPPDCCWVDRRRGRLAVYERHIVSFNSGAPVAADANTRVRLAFRTVVSGGEDVAWR